MKSEIGFSSVWSSSAVAWLQTKWRRLMRKKTARILICVRLRDGGSNQKRTTIDRTLIPQLLKQLVDRVEVREARVYEELWMHHKSYAEDFDLSNIERDIEAMLNAAKQGQPA